MNMKTLMVVVSAVALAASAAAQAQPSLPELARAEKARRAQLRKEGGPAKVYTEGDRRSGDVTSTEVTGAPTATTGAPAAGSASAKKEKTPEEIAGERQAEWNEKVKKAQDEIKELEATISRNERVMGSLINITPQRHDLGLQIEADKKKLVDLQKALVTLEDDRRRAGMPRSR